MIRKIKIGDKEVTFKTSAAIPHIYRRVFRRDIFVDMGNLEKKLKKNKDGSSELDIESLEMFENLAWCFNKHGDPAVPDDVEEWLEQFETFDIYNILPEILIMWNLDNATTSESKKK